MFVDLADLTWEQKEQVLRELFARMNGTKIAQEKRKKKLAIQKVKSSFDDYETDDEDISSDMRTSKNKYGSTVLTNAMYDILMFISKITFRVHLILELCYL